MKLNNKGWGLGVFIAFLCVFVIFLLVISILAPSTNDYIDDVENKKTEIGEIKGTN